MYTEECSLKFIYYFSSSTLFNFRRQRLPMHRIANYSLLSCTAPEICCATLFSCFVA